MVAEGGRRSEGRSPGVVGVGAGWTFGWPVASQPAGLRSHPNKGPYSPGGTGRLAFWNRGGEGGRSNRGTRAGESEALNAGAPETIKHRGAPPSVAASLVPQRGVFVANTARRKLSS